METMRPFPFLLFAWDKTGPGGGLYDCYGAFATEQGAQESLTTLATVRNLKVHQAQIVEISDEPLPTLRWTYTDGAWAEFDPFDTPANIQRVQQLGELWGAHA